MLVLLLIVSVSDLETGRQVILSMSSRENPSLLSYDDASLRKFLFPVFGFVMAFQILMLYIVRKNKNYFNK